MGRPSSLGDELPPPAVGFGILTNYWANHPFPAISENVTNRVYWYDDEFPIFIGATLGLELRAGIGLTEGPTPWLSI
ncbi:MAG: hypothetical protein AAFX93_07365 [Verrucomicrobiota bacterium]